MRSRASCVATDAATADVDAVMAAVLARAVATHLRIARAVARRRRRRIERSASAERSAVLRATTVHERKPAASLRDRTRERTRERTRSMEHTVCNNAFHVTSAMLSWRRDQPQTTARTCCLRESTTAPSA